MKTKARKAAKKAAGTPMAKSKARINKLPKGSSLVVPIAKRKVVTHTINVPKDVDEVVVRIVLGGAKVKALSYIGPKSQADDDVG
ncbi:MAG: hypothetical protein IPL06_04920 [Betaproteobacteria bacterium]|nr:hypothetical protein [Betaproteobacteria bacterium]